jgi:endonuclease/exonuclease/phosphatase family metal-dependent hydrolase
LRARILTVSVENFYGDLRRQELLASELQRLAPDLVVLQKVVEGNDEPGLAALLNNCGLFATHQGSLLAYEMPAAAEVGGMAIATRWGHRVMEVLDVRMPAADGVPWCTLAAIVDVPGAGEMLFIGTTAIGRFDAEWAHERQAVMLSELDARHRRALPTVIAGDFNAPPDAASIRYLSGLQSLGGRSVWYHDAWAVAGEGPGHTWTTDNAIVAERVGRFIHQFPYRRRIDYVFIGSYEAHPGAYCTIQNVSLAFDRPVDGVWPSDHYGVMVDVEIGTDA